MVNEAAERGREAAADMMASGEEWPEPEGDFGGRPVRRDPLRRALLNSPLHPCPDLDNVWTAEDAERAAMGPCP